MSNERSLIKFAMVTSAEGQSVDVLADLGNCYKIVSGHNRLSKVNIKLYLDNAFANVPKFHATSRHAYETDLQRLKLSMHSFENDTIAFGELCRAFFKLKYNALTSSPVEEKFRDAVKKRLGLSPLIDFNVEDNKWNDALKKCYGVKEHN